MPRHKASGIRHTASRRRQPRRFALLVSRAVGAREAGKARPRGLAGVRNPLPRMGLYTPWRTVVKGSFAFDPGVAGGRVSGRLSSTVVFWGLLIWDAFRADGKTAPLGGGGRFMRRKTGVCRNACSGGGASRQRPAGALIGARGRLASSARHACGGYRKKDCRDQAHLDRGAFHPSGAFFQTVFANCSCLARAILS